MAKIHHQQVPFGRIYVYTAAIAFVPSLIWNFVSIMPFFQTLWYYLANVPNIIILGVSYLGILRAKHVNKSVNLDESKIQNPE